MRTTRSLPLLLAGVLSLPLAAWSPHANPAHTVYAVEGAPGSLFGWAVSELADTDGDGVTDWIAGAVTDDGDLSGAFEVRSGATGELRFRRTGDPGDLLGWAIADVGDVDGDGTHDVAAGAPRTDANGYVEVVSGATGELIRRVDGPGASDFGAAVGDAGDLDGDGAADVLVGAPSAAGGGATHVVSGATGTTLRTYPSPEPGASFGAGTDGAGDLDGDGQTEHIIGAADAGAEDRGAAYVYDGATGILRFSVAAAPGGEEFGRFFVAGVGTVDGDDVPDVYVGDYADDTDGPDAGSATVFSGVDGARIHRFVGDPGDGMGPGRAAGDLDRDGRTDLVVGSYTSGDGAPNAGQVTVFAGRTGGDLLTITSRRQDEQLGFDAVGLGDATGDGKPDLLVSAANGDRVYLYRGPGVRHGPR